MTNMVQNACSQRRRWMRAEIICYKYDAKDVYISPSFTIAARIYPNDNIVQAIVLHYTQYSSVNIYCSYSVFCCNWKAKRKMEIEDLHGNMCVVHRSPTIIITVMWHKTSAKDESSISSTICFSKLFLLLRLEFCMVLFQVSSLHFVASFTVHVKHSFSSLLFFLLLLLL